MKKSLWIRTFKGDMEVGEPVKVEGAPLMAMIKVFAERTFDTTPGALIPNHAWVEEQERENEWGMGPIKLLLGIGPLANHLGNALLETDWAALAEETPR